VNPDLRLGTLPLEAAPRWKHTPWLGVVLPLFIILLIIAAPPWSIQGKARLVGYGVCHQIPKRSFQPGGTPLPLCARCSGTFLGGFLGFATIWAMGRGRAALIPPVKILVVLVGFVLFMGVDGLNSFMSFFPSSPHLYKPSNLLRMISGTLNGLALSIVLHPILNLTLWRNPEQRQAVEGFRSLGRILAVATLLVVVVNAEWAATFYPLTILSALSVIFMLTIINTTILTIALRRENTFQGWRDALPFFLWGIVLSIVEIGVIDLLRAWLTSMLPTPL